MTETASGAVQRSIPVEREYGNAVRREVMKKVVLLLSVALVSGCRVIPRAEVRADSVMRVPAPRAPALRALEGAIIAASLGQAAPRVFVSAASKLEWSHDLKDITGANEKLAAGEVALSAPTADIRTTPAEILATLPATNPEGSPGTSLSTLFAGRAGGDYRLWVRVRDEAGNWSPWSEPFLVTADTRAPTVPTGLKIVLTVTIP